MPFVVAGKAQHSVGSARVDERLDPLPRARGRAGVARLYAFHRRGGHRVVLLEERVDLLFGGCRVVVDGEGELDGAGDIASGPAGFGGRGLHRLPALRDGWRVRAEREPAVEVPPGADQPGRGTRTHPDGRTALPE